MYVSLSSLAYNIYPSTPSYLSQACQLLVELIGPFIIKLRQCICETVLLFSCGVSVEHFLNQSICFSQFRLASGMCKGLTNLSFVPHSQLPVDTHQHTCMHTLPKLSQLQTQCLVASNTCVSFFFIIQFSCFSVLQTVFETKICIHCNRKEFGLKSLGREIILIL